MVIDECHGVACGDMDECVFGGLGCDVNAVCIETEGGYTCRCKPGFDGDGRTCVPSEPSPFGLLDVGGAHTCGIREDGTLWCWGSNSVGTLGVGDEVDRHSPVQVGEESDWSTVTAGYAHSCATRRGGSLWCWGYDGGLFPYHDSTINSLVPVGVGANQEWRAASASEHTCAIRNDDSLWCWNLNQIGQLGDGTRDNRAIPTREATESKWLAVATGGEHTCGIQVDGSLWCWGSSVDGQSALPMYSTGRYTATRVGEDSDWSTVTTGYMHTCGIRTGGSLWCWGQNVNGQLGDGTNFRSKRPLEVGSGIEWMSVVAGYRHTCAVAVEGSLWCWGYNGWGQLGDGTTVDRNGPTRVGGDTDWLEVGGGYRHTCARRATGQVWCWGARDLGQLGDGIEANAAEPSRVGKETWQSVAAAQSSACSIRTDGGLWCWGNNFAGQLGDGTNMLRQVPTQVGGAADWKTAHMGGSTVCATRLDGSLWCWGLNSAGQLGVGTTEDCATPCRVGSDWQDAVVGGAHVCGINATDSSLWCWGSNRNGQLGNGTSGLGTDVLSPSRVGGDTQWLMLAAGSRHTCGVHDDRSLWCWGSNGFGQLGDGTWEQERNVPTPVDGGPSEWLTVVANENHTCGLGTNGDLWCWGRNDSGQLGDGASGMDADRNTPTLVVGDGWAEVGVGSGHTCATQENGGLWCWGNNGWGQLGDGTRTSHALPARVGTRTDWSSVAPGSLHSCGLQRGGSLWCWGSNDNGQLGDGLTWSAVPVAAVR